MSNVAASGRPALRTTVGRRAEVIIAVGAVAVQGRVDGGGLSGTV
jgi:hypothetical protein